MSTARNNPSTDENRVLEQPPDLRKRFRKLTSFQQTILHKIAALGSPNGLEIKAKLESYYNAEVNNGRIYPTRHASQERFVLKGERDKRTDYYELTSDAETVVKNGGAQ